MYRDSRLPVDDLVQEGCIGLLSALRAFDPGRGVKFSTFAGPAIRWSILRAQSRGRKSGVEFSLLGDQFPARDQPDLDAKDETATLLRCLPERDRRIVE